jgi:L-fuconolactonase
MCKLSGLVTEANWADGNGPMPQDARIMLECFDRALEMFGPNRIIYGSDWPVCQLAARYEVVHEVAQRWANNRLTALEQNAFWSDNAVRCYGLTIPTAS